MKVMESIGEPLLGIAVRRSSADCEGGHLGACFWCIVLRMMVDDSNRIFRAGLTGVKVIL